MIFIPIIIVDAPVQPAYVNEWQTQIYVDEYAWEEDATIPNAWDYLDPQVDVVDLNPYFEFHAQDGWLIDYVNFYMIENHSYNWWTISGIEACFTHYCVMQGDDWFKIESDLDIDVFIIKLKEE